MSAKAAKKTAETPAKTVEAVIAAGQDATETVIKAATESYEKAFASATDKVEEMVKGYDEFAEFGKTNVEVAVASGNAYAKGMEQLTSGWLAYTKQSMEEGAAAAQAMMGAKTLQDLFSLQSNFAKAQFDGFVSQSTKSGELATKVTQDALAPINSCVSATVEKWAKAAA